MVNFHATDCLAKANRGQELPEPAIFEGFNEAAACVRRQALPPMRKAKGALGPARTRAFSAFDEIKSDTAFDTPPEGPTIIAYDGSYTGETDTHPAKCGYGITVASPTSADFIDACGPVDLEGSNCHGAEKHSNNTAELTAAIVAMKWLLTCPAIGDVVIKYDSEYSHSITVGDWKPHANFRLAAKARRLWTTLAQKNPNVSWLHVDSHTGDFLNERADELADLGAGGQTRHIEWLP